jgi:iron(III) transport system permease protein
MTPQKVIFLLTQGGAALLLAPFAMLLLQSFASPLELNPITLLDNALSTAQLLFCVAIVTLTLGVTTGFLIGLCDFKGRKLLSILLLLPLAMPSYLVAFSYGELLDNLGLMQQALRSFMGYKSRRDYYFPEIRSFWGAVWLFSFTLYPYVYLASRLAFERQASRLLEAGLVLGATKAQVLRRIALKLAIPASLSGLSLVLFEVLNDIGLVTYCAVPTLSLYSLTLWLERGNLAGASFLALVLIGLILLTLKFIPQALEQKTGKQEFKPLFRFKGLLIFILGCLPPLFGFVLPFVFMIYLSLTAKAFALSQPLLHSLGLAFFTCLVTLIFGFVLSKKITLLNRLATLGYALPGSVLALGLLGLYGKTNATVFLGTSLGLVLALSFRFLTLAMEQFKLANEQLPAHVHDAARTLGAPPLRRFLRIDLPLLSPALKAAFLLVFIDCLKELPLTMLLRPVGVEPLSLVIFEAAQRGAFESAALASLFIVSLGLITLLLPKLKKG